MNRHHSKYFVQHLRSIRTHAHAHTHTGVSVDGAPFAAPFVYAAFIAASAAGVVVGCGDAAAAAVAGVFAAGDAASAPFVTTFFFLPLAALAGELAALVPLLCTHTAHAKRHGR